jgi:hypothetical protein
MMILMALIWEQFIKFNALDDIYAEFSYLYFHIACVLYSGTSCGAP